MSLTMPVDLQAEFRRRGPWLTKFVIRGEEYGNPDPAVDPKLVSLFMTTFPRVRTVLELGSLEGGHTFPLAACPTIDRVVAVEGRRENMERAEFVRVVLNEVKITFVNANLEIVPLSAFGQFDAIFCSGLLYHLPEPWKLIRQCGELVNRLFLATRYAREGEATELIENRYRSQIYNEGGPDEPLSGLSPSSRWLTLASLITMLGDVGYEKIQLLHHNMEHSQGPGIVIAASRGAPPIVRRGQWVRPWCP
jgi:SAM-dependent methyltransferase